MLLLLITFADCIFYPPGLPADPIIGHLRKLPPKGLQDLLYEWGKIYGMLWSITVLNSDEASVELLDKRGATYSDRPRFITLEIMGFSETLTLLGYGRKFETSPTSAAISEQQYLNKNTISNYQPIQTREARVLLQKLLSNSVDWHKQIQWLITRPQKRDCHFDFLPPNQRTDFLPFLRYFPSWFPGAYYAGFAHKHRHAVDKLRKYPYDRVKKDMAEGKAKPCFIALELEGISNEEDIEDIQDVAAAMYIGGAETTSSTMAFFVLAMVLFPEVQENAQKEIGRVVGSGRLPDFSDREALPYVECVVQETLRWRGAVPLGMPHRLLENDVYKGMFIPKGSLVIANTRAVTVDEKKYNNAHTFNPARYLPKPEGNAEPFPNGHFDFGRRICPGRHLADTSLWITMATILATLKISKAIGADGKEITPDESITTAFPMQLQARDDRAKALVMNADTSDYY